MKLAAHIFSLQFRARFLHIGVDALPPRPMYARQLLRLIRIFDDASTRSLFTLL